MRQLIHSTRYGRLVLQQKNQQWIVAQEIRGTGPLICESQRLVQECAASFERGHNKSLPVANSFDVEHGRFIFKLPDIPKLLPLAMAQSPLPMADAVRVLRGLAEPLKALHQLGLGAFDLSPSLIFVDHRFEHTVVVPTPWLPAFAIDGAAEQETVCVAPELDHPNNEDVNPVLADIYGLGALAWFLITGEARQRNSTLMPSEFSSDLVSWDRFVDGCCRSNPARRYTSVDAAVAEIPSIESVQKSATGIPSAQSTTLASVDDVTVHASPGGLRRYRKPMIALAAIVVLAVLWNYRASVTSIVPGMGGIFSDYERGFADTVIRYADRSYEGSEWEKVKSAEALRSIVKGDCSSLAVKGLAGWDADSYWVIVYGHVGGGFTRGALIFKKVDGHWSYHGAVEDKVTKDRLQSWSPRLMSKDTCLWATKERILRFSSDGITSMRYDPFMRHENICPISGDLYYVFPGVDSSAYKVAEGKVTELRREKDKEIFAHRPDNTPIRNYSIGDIRYTATFSPGHAVGLCVPSFEPAMIVEYRNGLWYKIKTLDPFDYGKHRPNNAWFGGRSGGPGFAVVVADGGYVFIQPFDGENIEQSVTPEQASTSLNLIAVWGVDLNKYWVMDDSGTIWERANDEWHVVVRGLYHEDVEFRTAWVSPNGTVIAATEDYIYRLD